MIAGHSSRRFVLGAAEQHQDRLRRPPCPGSCRGRGPRLVCGLPARSTGLQPLLSAHTLTWQYRLIHRLVHISPVPRGLSRRQKGSRSTPRRRARSARGSEKWPSTPALRAPSLRQKCRRTTGTIKASMGGQTARGRTGNWRSRPRSGEAMDMRWGPRALGRGCWVSYLGAAILMLTSPPPAQTT